MFDILIIFLKYLCVFVFGIIISILLYIRLKEELLKPDKPKKK